MEQKAYDIKVLVEKLKANGLEVAEEGAKVAVEQTIQWVLESAQASENKYDDFLALVLPVVKPTIMKAIEDINPADNA